MMKRRLKWFGVTATTGLLVLWLPLTSVALCAALHILLHMRPWAIPLAALTLWWDYGSDPRVVRLLPLCAGGAAVVSLVPAALVACSPMRPQALRPARPGEQPPPPLRAHSDVHGHADWLSIADARTIFTGDDPRWGSIPVGEAYRPDLDRTARPFDEADETTWGQGGRAPLLATPLTKGVLSGIIVAGSGSYKTMAFSVPAMCTWRGSVVVLDPSCQVGPMVETMRLDMGHDVVMLDPTGSGSAGRRPAAFNVLSCIDLDDPLAIVHLNEFIDWVAPEKDSNAKAEESFFVDAGKELLSCLLADLMWDTDLPPYKRTVREWRARQSMPEDEMQKYLTGIYARSKSPYARELAGTLMRTFKETFSGILKNATSATKWLSIPAYAEMLSNDTFDPALLIGGQLSLFVQIPDEAMRATPGIARVIIGSLARTLLKARGKTVTPVPFIMDEMDLLRNMPILAVMRDMGRKSGAALFPMWQSVGQIEKTWGRDGKKAWYASAAWRLYAAVNDEETAKEVSDRCGFYTMLTRSQGTSNSMTSAMSNGQNSRGRSDNLTEQPRALLSPYQVQTELRPDEAIVIPRGRQALRCGRPLWWRRPEMRALIEADTYRRAAE